ncbi:unnamed protein product, partial [Closterium sp. Naga37s-1]
LARLVRHTPTVLPSRLCQCLWPQPTTLYSLTLPLTAHLLTRTLCVHVPFLATLPPCHTITMPPAWQFVQLYLDTQLYVGSMQDTQLYVGSMQDTQLYVGSMQDTQLYVGSMQDTQLYVGSMQDTQLYVGSMQDTQLYVGDPLRLLCSPALPSLPPPPHSYPALPCQVILLPPSTSRHHPRRLVLPAPPQPPCCTWAVNNVAPFPRPILASPASPALNVRPLPHLHSMYAHCLTCTQCTPTASPALNVRPLPLHAACCHGLCLATPGDSVRGTAAGSMHVMRHPPRPQVRFSASSSIALPLQWARYSGCATVGALQWARYSGRATDSPRHKPPSSAVYLTELVKDELLHHTHTLAPCAAHILPSVKCTPRAHPMPRCALPCQGAPYHAKVRPTMPRCALPCQGAPYHAKVRPTMPRCALPCQGAPYHAKVRPTMPRCALPCQGAPYHAKVRPTMPRCALPCQGAPYHAKVRPTMPRCALPCQGAPYHAKVRPTMPRCALPCQGAPYHAKVRPTMPRCALPCQGAPYHAKVRPTMPRCALPCQGAPYHAKVRPTMPRCALPCQGAPYHAKVRPTMPRCALPCQGAPYHAKMRTVSTAMLPTAVAAVMQQVAAPVGGGDGDAARGEGEKVEDLPQMDAAKEDEGGGGGAGSVGQGNVGIRRARRLLGMGGGAVEGLEGGVLRLWSEQQQGGTRSEWGAGEWWRWHGGVRCAGRCM